jgi:hypothetical protein
MSIMRYAAHRLDRPALVQIQNIVARMLRLVIVYDADNRSRLRDYHGRLHMYVRG